MRFVVHHPATEGRLVFWRAFFTYNSDHDGLNANESNGADRFIRPRTRHMLIVTADAYFCFVMALAFLGLPAFVSRRSSNRIFLVLCAGAMAVVPLGLYGHPRFHAPVIPFLTILAAGPLCAVVNAGPRDGDRPPSSNSFTG